MSEDHPLWETLDLSFRLVELGPDAEWNARLSPERIRAEIEAGSAREIEHTRELNAELAEMGTSVEMAPFFGISPALWAHPSCIRLYTHLRLTPYEDWNRIHLPRGERGAWVMKTFPHPGELAWLQDQAIELVSIVMGRLDEVRVDPAATGATARQQLEVWREAREAQAIEVMNVTQTRLLMLGREGSEKFQEVMAKRERSPSGAPIFLDDDAPGPVAPGPVPTRAADEPDFATLMSYALVASFQLVAGADGVVDDKELKGFARSAHHHLGQHSEFAAVMDVLGTKFAEIGDRISCSNTSPAEHVARFADAARSGLSDYVSSKACKLVYFVGHEVAEVGNRGFLGRKRKISGAEARALEVLAQALGLE